MSELEDRMLSLRSKADYVLDPDKPVLMMIDGRAFSKLVKKHYKLPFDDDFIRIMDTVAIECCKEIQGCIGAYVQSDEISFFIDTRQKPGDEKRSTPYFGLRLCKISPIIASTAAGVFNREALIRDIKALCYDFTRIDGDNTIYTGNDIVNHMKSKKLAQFDAKAWNVENNNDVFAWFLYRQLDCIKNSKQQAAQTYLPHKQLLGKDADTQVLILEEEKGVVWENYEPEKKYGRFIWKEYEEHIDETYGNYIRSVWKSHPAWELSKDKEKFLKQFNIE